MDDSMPSKDIFDARLPSLSSVERNFLSCRHHNNLANCRASSSCDIHRFLVFTHQALLSVLGKSLVHALEPMPANVLTIGARFYISNTKYLLFKRNCTRL